MTKGYQILQKKLREVESSIDNLSSLYPAATPSLPHIAQQLVFSRKLLSAEISSSHPSKPHHLAHISDHLDRLDAIFRAYQDHHHGPHDTGGDFATLNGGFDAASACSCTESCLNDDGEGELGSELQCEEDPEEMFYEASGRGAEEERDLEEKVSSVEVGRVVVERSKTEKGGVEREEEGDPCGWWCFGVLGGGLVVGAAVGAVLMCSVMVRFSGCFHWSTTEYEGFLVPT